MSGASGTAGTLSETEESIVDTESNEEVEHDFLAIRRKQNRHAVK